MRIVPRLLLAALVVASFSLVTAPAAVAGSKQHPSDNTPWAIGLAVVVLLAIVFLLMSLRRGMSRRRETNHFRGDAS
jgi:uncharacterized BrkB/YihY/UPF0761 family membrane protein